jgi:hypothetical protein
VEGVLGGKIMTLPGRRKPEEEEEEEDSRW